LKRRFDSIARTLLAAVLVIAVPLSGAGSPSGEAVPPEAFGSRLVAAAASGRAAQRHPAAAQIAATGETPCRWWQFRRCDQPSDGPDIEGLPDGAPRTGTVITVDLSTNTLYLFKDGEVLTKSPVATGSGRILENGEDIWAFETPQGHMTVKGKVVDPVWRKPDWAFIEDGKKVPPANSPSRLVKGHLGKYALKLGDGIMIHGTDDPGSIGRRVSHGCIRLPARALAKVYKAAGVGTDVYVFESLPPERAVIANAPERHSDLDYLSKKKVGERE
jgi:lipoprotein-anchoring transpeptidase ErfK/SrfK